MQLLDGLLGGCATQDRARAHFALERPVERCDDDDLAEVGLPKDDHGQFPRRPSKEQPLQSNHRYSVKLCLASGGGE